MLLRWSVAGRHRECEQDRRLVWSCRRPVRLLSWEGAAGGHNRRSLGALWAATPGSGLSQGGGGVACRGGTLVSVGGRTDQTQGQGFCLQSWGVLVTCYGCLINI